MRFIPFSISTYRRLAGAIALSVLVGCGSSPQPEPVTSAAPSAPATNVAKPVTPTPGPVISADMSLLPRAVTSFGAAAHNGWLYTLGGYSGEPHNYSKEGQSGALHRLKLADGQTWQELPGVDHLQSVALVAHGDSLIRIGGMRALNSSSESERLSSVTEVARFVTGTGTWQDMPALPEGRSSHDAVIAGGVLYTIGGWQLTPEDGERKWHKTGLRLDLQAEDAQWSEFAVPFERRAFAVAATDRHLVAIGGMSSNNKPSKQVDIYNPQTEAWERGPDYPGWPFGVAAVGVGEHIYASGRDGGVYRLTVGTDAWQRVGALAFARFFHR
ncbi:MAG: hypothetical protein AAGC55_19430, partial [Myxococcota bacterium]